MRIKPARAMTNMLPWPNFVICFELNPHAACARKLVHENTSHGEMLGYGRDKRLGM